jgi:hypothetical protein
MKQFIRRFMLTTFFGTLMSGCGNGLFNTEPFVDSHIDENGNTVLEDTPRNWEFYAFSVDTEILRELKGEAPEAGEKTWNDYWVFRMKAIPANVENRERHINYIIDRRHQEGLPELEGYSK